MKKLVLLISFVAFIVVNAFPADYVIILNDRKTQDTYTGIATDTIGTSGSLTKKMMVKVPGNYNYDLTFDIDTLTGVDGNLTVTVSGAHQDIASWYTTLSTTTFTGSADTVFTVSNNTVKSISNSVSGYYWALDSLIYDDTLNVNVTETVTETLGGVGYDFIKVVFSGAANARYEVEYIDFEIKARKE